MYALAWPLSIAAFVDFLDPLCHSRQRVQQHVVLKSEKIGRTRRMPIAAMKIFGAVVKSKSPVSANRVNVL